MGSANQDRQLPPTSNFIDLLNLVQCASMWGLRSYNAQCLAHKPPDRPCFFFKSNTAEKMMRDSLRFFLRNLICNDRQTSVELHRIAVDDLTIVSARYLNRQLPAVVSDLRID